MENKHYYVNMVKHVNYTAIIEASSQEEAEEIATENTSEQEWTKMDGLQPTEICKNNGDYAEGEDIE